MEDPRDPCLALHTAALIGMIGRVDFRHSFHKVIVEIDSDLHHTSISDRRRDTIRRKALEAAGWIVIQVTEFELWHQPEKMLDRIRVRARVSLIGFIPRGPDRRRSGWGRSPLGAIDPSQFVGGVGSA